MTSTVLDLSPAGRRAALDALVIKNPRFIAAQQTFDYMIEHASYGNTNRCVAMLAPSQSGKTTIIDSYVSRLNTPEALAAGEIPALKVTLQANINRRQFAQDILAAFEAFGCNALVETGTEAQLLRRAKNYLALRRVRVLFLDEFHHLVHSDNRKVVVSVSETVKNFVDTGSCPIVMAGLEEARKPFDVNRQLAHRAEPHIYLKPLVVANDEDRGLFRRFLSDYLVQADQLGVADGLLELTSGDAPACIWEVSQGVLGGGGPAIS